MEIHWLHISSWKNYRLSEQQPDSRDQGHRLHDDGQGFLRHPFDDEDADRDARHDEGRQDRVEGEEFQSGGAEGEVEGQLGDVDDEKVPGVRPDEILFLQPEAQEVHDEQGGGGVGHHGRYAGEQADESRDDPVVGLDFRVVAGSEDAEQGDGDDDGAEDGPELRVVYQIHQEVADGDARDGPGENCEDELPVRPAAPVDDGEDVGEHEYGQKDARRLLGGHDEGEQRRDESDEARDAALGDARTERSGNEGYERGGCQTLQELFHQVHFNGTVQSAPAQAPVLQLQLKDCQRQYFTATTFRSAFRGYHLP